MESKKITLPEWVEKIMEVVRISGGSKKNETKNKTNRKEKSLSQ